MNYYLSDPIADPRWTSLVETSSRASIFHTVGWLRALQTTYGYEPYVITTSPHDTELKNGLVFCRVNSWLSGDRLVSLPFSDHCEPLCESEEEMHTLIDGLKSELVHQKCGYLELRPINWIPDRPGFESLLQPRSTYFLHRLNLTPGLDELLHSFDKDSVQRRIQRAQSAGLTEKCGNSEDLLKEFYSLFVITRRRHQIPPSPYSWFQNLIRNLRDSLEIRVAYQDERPIASIVTLRFRTRGYYKYSCSDPHFNNLGATPWLMWNAITSAKANGAIEFDLGRTEEGNAGLLLFKNHWVPHPQKLTYFRFPFSSKTLEFGEGWKMHIARRVVSFMPGRLLALIGRTLYRHIG